MKCPHCNHEFTVTLRQYLREPRGRHNCPSCGQRFKLVYSFAYIFTLIGIVLVLAVAPALLVLYFSREWPWAALTYVICSLALVLPADLWLDNNRRSSAKL